MRNDSAIVIAVLVGALVSFARADRIVLQSGRAFEGEVVAETSRSVTLESFVLPGYTMERRFDRSQIKTWHRPSREGVPYVVIPVFGEIGNDVTADALRNGLAKARAANPRYIILAIDSPGGDIWQMNEMIDAVIEASKQTNVTAYVKQAYSAAAVLAMCCPEVYMKPDAVIGAAVPFTATENGPVDVDAKFRSAIEAKMRAAAQHGDHADLLMRGMSELNLQIFLAMEHGKPVLRTFGPGKVIKRDGEILTLTAHEAVQCGLARIAPTMADLGKQVAGGPWHEATRRPWNAVIGTVALARQHEKDVLDQQQRHATRQAAIARVRPEADAIMRRARELTAQRAAAQSAINDLTSRGNIELAQVEHQYQQELGLAKYQADPTAAIARAVEVRNSRAMAVRQQFDANVTALRAQDAAARAELAQLTARMKQLLESVPSE